MSFLFRKSLIAATAIALFYVPAASAQQATPPKPTGAHGAHHGAGATHEAGKEEEHERSGWAQLDAFHDVMSAAWHPARNDSLAVARATADKLVLAAKSWATSTAPKGCEAPAVKSSITKLVPEAEAVAALVARSADDASVKAALKTVHDTYHVAEAACKPVKHAGH